MSAKAAERPNGADSDRIRITPLGLLAARLAASQSALAQLVSVMERCEPDTPHAERASDEEWSAALASARELVRRRAAERCIDA